VTELETLVRDALRANEISAADLRQPELREPDQGDAWRFTHRLPTILAAAAVVVLAAVLSVVLTHRSHRGEPAVSHDVTALVGTSWRAVSLTDRYGSYSFPSDVVVTIRYPRAGLVTGNDGMDERRGGLVPIAGGYKVPGSTVVDLPTAARHLDIRAIDVMSRLFDRVAVGNESNPPAPRVAVSFVGNHLTLRANHVSLELVRTGSR
jgi:hypothetical protein